MPPRDTLEKDLAALRAVRADPNAPGADALLKRVLESGQSFAAAAAAEIIGGAPRPDLAHLLPPAFDRFLGKAADPNCRVKTAVAIALQTLESDDAALFLRGIEVVQAEPVLGGRVDTAAELRGACALGLARAYHPDGLDAIARLLLDPEWVARVHAARALGASGRVEAIPLLRFKARAGDPEPQVMTDVFASILDLQPDEGIEFVASFLRGAKRDSPPRILHAVTAGGAGPGHNCTLCGGVPADRSGGAGSSGREEPEEFSLLDGDPVAESAALALGQSRREAAFPILRDHAARQLPALARVPLLAVALLRSKPALDHLAGLVEKAPVEVARHAVAALAVHRYDDSLRARVETAVAARKSKQLSQAFEKAFAGP